jgi:hypothetical protein
MGLTERAAALWAEAGSVARRRANHGLWRDPK